LANVEHYAVLAATSSKEAFRARLAGAAVLVRLDERGGKLDPAPWAFSPPQAARFSAGPRRDEEVGAEALRAALAGDMGEASDEPAFHAAEEEATATTLSPPPVVPAAGGAASVLELPALGRGEAAVRIGRGAENHVVISERSLSRHHARLLPRGDGFVVEDTGSQNGTKLNGRPLPAGGVLLKSGDILAFGDVECVFLDADEFQERLPEFMD
jgi:hypothetical protein